MKSMKRHEKGTHREILFIINYLGIFLGQN